MSGHAAAARTINVRREGALTARSDFDLSALESGQFPSDWTFVRGWVLTGQVDDAFLAIQHDVAPTTPRIRSSKEDESMVPLRSVDSIGERYRGPRGRLVIMKRK